MLLLLFFLLLLESGSRFSAAAWSALATGFSAEQAFFSFKKDCGRFAAPRVELGSLDARTVPGTLFRCRCDPLQ